MAGPSAPPSAPPPHEDTPPPQYCDVVTTPPVIPEEAPGNAEDRARTRGRLPVLVFGLVLTLSLTVVLGCMVGDLWVRLETLQVRVEHRNEKEVAKIKAEIQLLKRDLQKYDEMDEKILNKMDFLSRRIDGLQEAFKTGDVKYIVVSSAQNLQKTQKTFVWMNFVLLYCNSIGHG